MLAQKLLTAGKAVEPVYIEEVFSTYLYTGNGSTQTITNGIDLSTKGGLVWQKDRSQGTGYHHVLQDTVRGATNCLFTNLTSAQSQDSAGTGFVFNNNGFTIGTNNVKVNGSGDKYVSWTFRKQPKFFDVVTFLGTGSVQNIAHNLGSTPAFIIVKGVDIARFWACYHTSTGATKYLELSATTGATTDSTFWNDTAPTSTQFTVGTATQVNLSGYTYVAYLFASDAGGFGITGADNVISCGGLNTGASGTSGRVNLGWEPQFVIIKRTNLAEGWMQFDNMRGLGVLYNANKLLLNTYGAEQGLGADECFIDSTGFTVGNVGNNQDFIYIAIRRGPMKVPTSGTSVYGANTWSGAGSTTFNSFAPDWATRFQRNATNATNTLASARLTGETYLITSSTAVETPDNVITFNNAGGGASVSFGASGNLVSYFFKRAPSFFDVVCYTGNGTAGATQTHNLGAVPEMMIVKDRNYSGGRPWTVYHSALGATKFTYMNQTTTPTTGNQAWNDTAPTASVFTLGSNSIVNFSGTSYVAYLFATCAGVSKVGSYTGNGYTQTINCGFTNGARFVLIKRTDNLGDWYVWDSARGITSGNDPYLLLNKTDAEITTNDTIDPDSSGFIVNSTFTDLNGDGASYIFLAIA